MRLSVIIPVYNEEKLIFKTLNDYSEYLKKLPFEYEIIIVNDGSTDNTISEIEKFKSKNNQLKIVDLKKNLGKGAAIKTGLLESHGCFRMFLDADNSSSIDHLEKAWPLLEQGYEIIIGSRSRLDSPDAKMEVPQFFLKALCGKFGNLIFKIFTVQGIKDTQCGFKIFSENFVNSIISKTKINRWAWDAEVLTLAKKNGFKIGIIGIRWKDSKQKSKVGIKGYLIALKEALQIRWNIIKNKY